MVRNLRNASLWAAIAMLARVAPALAAPLSEPMRAGFPGTGPVADFSAAQIANQFAGVSRNSIMGKVSRMKLGSHGANPHKRDAPLKDRAKARAQRTAVRIAKERPAPVARTVAADVSVVGSVGEFADTDAVEDDPQNA